MDKINLEHLYKVKKEKKEKHPGGRPKIWTDEKIKQRKQEKKDIATKNREDLKDIAITSKISLNQDVGDAARYRLLQKNRSNKKQVDELIIDKRERLKALTEAHSFERVCAHADKYAYMGQEGSIFSTCTKCSRLKKWHPREWEIFVFKNRKTM